MGLRPPRGDVSLATYYVFDKENPEHPRSYVPARVTIFIPALMISLYSPRGFHGSSPVTFAPLKAKIPMSLS